MANPNWKEDVCQVMGAVVVGAVCVGLLGYAAGVMAVGMFTPLTVVQAINNLTLAPIINGLIAGCGLVIFGKSHPARTVFLWGTGLCIGASLIASGIVFGVTGAFWQACGNHLVFMAGIVLVLTTLGRRVFYRPAAAP